MDEKLEKIRHSASHILAAAVKFLFPDVKLGIGPAIEDGFYYDFDNLDISPEDLKKIEKKMKEIIKKNEKFENITKSLEEAKDLLMDEPYKLELLEDLEGDITFYKNGDFIDLCKGPHVESTKEVRSFKLLNIAGAYWKGDSKNKQLTRIYGVAFPTKEELKQYIHLREEAEKRDHKKLGKQLDLFSFHEEGPGFPFFHNNGMIVWNELMEFWREEHKKAGYKEIRTPIVLNRALWEQSGHWDHFKENMYFTNIDERDFAVKPMNCPGGMLVYKTKLHSYRELPLRVAEVGLVHRHELSGTLNGLFRVRAFFQDDAHIFCTEEQITDEVLNIIGLINRMYGVFDLDYHMELSTKPGKAIGSDEMWESAENALKKALEKNKADYKLNPGDGAFYGPKIDFHAKDAIGRTWQCATIQLDFAMPERFDLKYEGQDGRKHRPVMLHRVVYGGIERFIGILIEHFAGKFPLWLNPTQVIVLTVTDRSLDFAEEIKKMLESENFRVKLDNRVESMPKKVRDAQQLKPNYIITIGDKEAEKKTLAIRTRDNKVKFDVKVNNFIDDLKKEREEKRC